MNIIALLVLWTWGLTPTWVNVVSTVLLSINILAKFLNFCLKVGEKMQE